MSATEPVRRAKPELRLSKLVSCCLPPFERDPVPCCSLVPGTLSDSRLAGSLVIVTSRPYTRDRVQPWPCHRSLGFPSSQHPGSQMTLGGIQRGKRVSEINKFKDESLSK